jgi:hypothetical protein
MIPCERNAMVTARWTIMFLVLATIASLVSGCQMISVLASPAPYDIKVPAEIDLKGRSEKKIVIFVEPTRSVSAPGLDSELAAAIKAELIKKVSIQSGYLFVSGEASPGRANMNLDFRLLSPSQIAREQNAGTILYIRIEEFQMTMLHRQGYFTGHLVTRSMIFDDAGTQLWPTDSSGRLIRTRDEVETGGSDVTRTNLIDATTHCVCRYLYECPKPDFKTKYEEIDYTKDEIWD